MIKLFNDLHEDFFENDQFVLNSDSRRDLPVPFRTIDGEEDPVRVAIQWRRAGEPFLPLPASATA